MYKFYCRLFFVCALCIVTRVFTGIKQIERASNTYSKTVFRLLIIGIYSKNNCVEDEII